MQRLRDTDEAIVIRTDFSNDTAWSAIQAGVKQEVERGTGDSSMMSIFDFVSDTDYAGATIDKLLALAPEDGELTFFMVADGLSMVSEEHAVLVVDTVDEPGRQFRAVPRALFSIAANLSIANMDFADFADNVDDDGVLRR